jgi:nucleoside-diphosphate-sugar epimerase
MSNNERPVLVIGATGFLGRRVVACLQEKGRVVRCMARAPDKAQDLVTEGVSVVQGDMLDAASGLQQPCASTPISRPRSESVRFRTARGTPIAPSGAPAENRHGSSQR